LDLGRGRLEQQREAITIQIKTLERDVPLLEASIQRVSASTRQLEV